MISDSLVYSIISGEFCIHCGDKQYVFRQPGIITSSRIYNSSNINENRFKKDGFLSSEEEKELLYKYGLWSDDLEKEFENTKTIIREITKSLPEFEYKTIEKNMLVSRKKMAETKLKELLELKMSFFTQTIDYQLKKYQASSILPYSIYFNGALLWKDQKEFDEEMSADLINCLTGEILKDFYSEKEIRKIARSEPWRSIWKTYSNSGGDLFGRPLADMAKSQRDLTYWSNIYDNVFESHERPDWSVIDDDEALDKWFEEQYNKTNKKKTAFTTNPKIAAAKEVFIVAQTPQDAQKVYSSMNTPLGLASIQSRNRKLETKGAIKEHELPDVQVDIQIQQNNLKVKK